MTRSRHGQTARHLTEAHIWQMVILMIDRYGPEAALEIAVSCYGAIDRADTYRCAIWKRTQEAMERLVAQEPSDGEAIH